MIKGVLLDLSGVVFVGKKAVPGAVEAVARLRQSGLPIRFLSNSTRLSKQHLLDLLHGMGASIDRHELFTPAAAARAWLSDNRRSAHLLIDPDLEADFYDIPDHPAQAVVIGDAGTGFTYQRLNTAFRLLERGAAFLALADNRTFMDADGELSLDAGAFVAALEFATRQTAIVLGKPSRDFFVAALSSMNCQPENAVMVGDDAEMDVAGALRAGLARGLLVRSGKYTDGVEATTDPTPTAVVDDLAAAVEWILNNRDRPSTA